MNKDPFKKPSVLRLIQTLDQQLLGKTIWPVMSSPSCHLASSSSSQENGEEFKILNCSVDSLWYRISQPNNQFCIPCREANGICWSCRLGEKEEADIGTRSRGEFSLSLTRTECGFENYNFLGNWKVTGAPEEGAHLKILCCRAPCRLLS